MTPLLFPRFAKSYGRRSHLLNEVCQLNVFAVMESRPVQARPPPSYVPIGISDPIAGVITMAAAASGRMTEVRKSFIMVA